MSEIDPEVLQSFLDDCVELLTKWEKECLALEKEPSQAILDSLFRAAHNLKGTSRVVGLAAFGDTMHRVEDLLGLLHKEPQRLTPQALGFLLECQAFFLNWVKGLRTNEHYAPDTSSLQVSLKGIFDGRSANSPQAKPAPSQAPIVEPSQPKPSQAKPAEKKVESDSKQEKTRSNESIRVLASKLDQIIQLVGELSMHQAVITHGRDTQNLESKAYDNSVTLAAKITKDLQSHAISLRMLSIEGVFQRLERTARDIARSQGKAIEVRLEGNDVELDKTVLELIADPLVHMVRNSIDHGIESKDERAKCGKAPVGQLTISATQESGFVLVSVRDDGKGLDRERIFKKAAEKGLIPAGEKLDSEETFKLIFLPGFSTAEKITDISGRGVGMDVVRTAVDSLGGDIHIASESGKGTSFTVSIPTTLSIQDALVVVLNEQRYVVPIQNLDEIVNLQETKIETMSNLQKVISLRGKAVPLEDLRRYLPTSITSRASHPQSQLMALLVKSAGERLALSVDSVLGQQQIFIRPLDVGLEQIPGFCGGTILSDGEPALIIDLPKISKAFWEHSQAGKAC